MKGIGKMKKIIVVTAVASVATGVFAGWGDLGKATAGVGAKTAIKAAAAAQEQKERERQAKKEELLRQRTASKECQQAIPEEDRKVDVTTSNSEKVAKENSQQLTPCGKLEDRLVSFCGFKFGEKGKSGNVALKKPFRMFKTAKVVCEDERIKEVSLILSLTSAMDSDARKKEVAAIKDILEKKYQITFEFQDGTMWDSFLKAYTYNENGAKVELYYNNMKDYITITVGNVPAWKKACAPAELPADAGADAL